MDKPNPHNFDEIFAALKSYDGHFVETHIKKYQELDKILPINNTFYIITDTQTSKYPFVTQNFKYNLGLDPDKMKTIGVPYWLEHFHPDEVVPFMNMLEDLIRFLLMEVPPDDRMRCVFTWHHKIRTAGGEYLNLHEQSAPLAFDADYKPLMAVTTSSIIGNDTSDFPIIGSVKILNKHTEYETLYVKNYSQQLLADELSNRERDIIRLLALNNTSKEIGENLFISPHTVDTHRRNIIKKLNIDSTAELKAYFKKNLHNF